MAETLITLTLNQDWTYDKAYKAGEVVKIPVRVYEEVSEKIPTLFTVKKEA